MDSDKILSSTVLDVKLTNGNDGQGRAYYRSANEKKRLLKLLADKRQTEPFKVPVHVIITRILGKGQRLWDFPNGLRGNAKQLIDALVDLGWFEDDGPKYITACDFRQDKTRRDEGPAVLIDVYEAE